MKTLVLYFSLLLLPLACKKAEHKQEEALDAAVEVVEAEAEESSDNLIVTPLQDKTSDAYADRDSSKEITFQPKIIRTATLRFETPDLNASFYSIQKEILKHKATIQNDDSGKNYESAYRNITVRIPSASFEVFIAAISQGVKHFDRKEISAQDVTEEYIDVQARLNAKRVLEKRYFELLNKATKVSEMLEIEKELSAIREEIEAKEGRLKYLQNQVSLSTVHLEMYTNNPSESGAMVSYFTKMWNAVKSGGNNLATFLLGLLHIWPFILIFVVMILFIRRRFKKKTT
ncbi:DUF4349 domain-containing protein [Flavobacterium sp. SM15]|uniref:DUF4349 domain-containing protein n=1 Tax=Flavobacterium sp. SM15 TaxID=2908005 RepID=UPI001EDC6A8B|nr:DUF4349 domain-containing protein [Flavobacterium sp. SM15]MCG2610418.1 DUF4349 domain-containing protein [Flavobacterium sp. SM15]